MTRGQVGTAMVAAATLAVTLAAARAGLAAGKETAGLEREDAAAINAVVEAYRTAWLKGDAPGVMATLTDDAVLLPAHGARPIEGTDAIKAYWWPAGAPPSTITKLDISIEGLGGDGQVAFSHGRDDVAWTQDDKGATRAYGHPGTYLNVYRKGTDGRWRISRHMWDDGPAAR